MTLDEALDILSDEIILAVQEWLTEGEEAKAQEIVAAWQLVQRAIAVGPDGEL